MATPRTKAWRLEGALLLRRWRADAALTQSETSARIGVDLPRYNAFENGRARPGLDHAVKIAEVTDGKVPVESWTIAVTEREWAKAS